MKRLIPIFIFLILISACRKVELYHDLNEEEANDILVVLQTQGIDANKIKEVKQNETFWTVQVDSNKIAEARKVLVEHNLPRKKEPGLQEVYNKEKSLIPTPDEQRARFLLAIKGEIINSLKKIPDVVDADVVLNIPEKDEVGIKPDPEKRPTASVIVKVKPTGANLESVTEPKLQQFVANAVSNLNPRDVSVIITYITPPKTGIFPNQSIILPNEKDGQQADANQPITKIAGIEVSSSSQGRLKLYLAVFFMLLGVLAAVLIVTVIKTSRIRQELKDYKEGPNGPMVEGKVVDERPRIEGR